MVRTKEKKESSLSAVMFSTVAAIILGIVIGVGIEISRKPDFARTSVSLKDNADKTDLTFRMGSRSGGDPIAAILRRANQGTLNDSTIVFDEGNLNTIADDYFNFTLGKQQFLKGDESPTYALLPDTPNFAMDDDLLQVVIPVEAFLFQLKGSGFLILRGYFEEGERGPNFVVQESWINSARLPSIAGDLLLNRLAKNVVAMGSDSPILKIWSQIDDAQVQGRELRVTPR